MWLEEIGNDLDGTLHAEQADKVPHEQAAALLAREVEAGRCPLKNWDNAVDQWILRLNQLVDWNPEFELPKLGGNRITAGALGRWHDYTQITYFGNGPDTTEDERSEYRLKATNVVGYATYRPIQSLAIGGKYGWLGSMSLREPGGSFKRGNPAAQVTFPSEPAFLVDGLRP